MALTAVPGHNPIRIYSVLDVTFGNGTFVAVGSPQLETGGNTTNNILTSIDGINWTAHRSSPTTNSVQSINAVAYGGGYFVAVGAGGYFYTSSDGSTWTRTIPFLGQNINYSSIVYGNGKFIASYGSSTNLIISNPGSFTTQFQSSGTTAAFGKLAFANGLFLAAAHSSSLGTNVLLTSTDGANWVQHTFYYGNTVYGMVFDGRQFVAVGYSYYDLNNGYDISTVFTSAPLISLGLNFNGSPQLNLSGAVGLSYRIDYLNQLPTNAVNAWHPLTNFTMTSSPCIWTDTQTPGIQSRYYRAVLLP